MPTELEKYRDLVCKHPMAGKIIALKDVNYRGRMTGVTLQMRPSDWGESVFVTGVSIQCPEDTYDPKVGKLVAMYDALQRSKSFLSRKPRRNLFKLD